MKKTPSNLRRAILIGPSIDLPRSSKKAWLSKRLRALKPGPDDILVGIDGGVEFASIMRKSLHFAVGDWDGVREATLERLRHTGTAVVTLPAKKDESDLAVALALIGEFPISELVLLGFTGGRPDHHLSNLLEIARFAASHRTVGCFQKIAAIGPEAEYHFLTHRQAAWNVRNRRGTLISVFSLAGAAKGVTMNGFEYGLHQQELKPSSRGLSNVVRSSLATVRLSKGSLVLVIPNAR